MKIVIDNQIVKALDRDTSILKQLETPIYFGWGSLFEFLGLSLFKKLPSFDESQPLFRACVSTLFSTDEIDVVCYVFDRLFAETLNQIKNLPEIKAPFLYQKFKEECKKYPSLKFEKTFIHSIGEEALLNNPSDVNHQLTLYLAWDRMCMSLALLFDNPSSDLKFSKNLSVLKKCLIESYQHIFHDGRTIPSIYRLFEALFYYQMRNENLQKHTEDDWKLLNNSFQALKDKNEICDVYYIDEAITLLNMPEREKISNKSFFTQDTAKIVQCRSEFSLYMMAKIKEETPNWNFVIGKNEIITI